MAAEPTFSRNHYSRSKEGIEPGKNLRRRWSIRLSRGSYSRQSSKSAKSQFDWIPVDESGETASLQQPSYKKFNTSVDAKDGSFQEGIDYDDVNSVVSSSCGSSERVVCPSSTLSDDAAMPRHQSSLEVSDTSPKSLKETRDQESPHDSESSYDSSDHSKSQHYAPSKTIYSGQKSLRTLTRSSSTRAVKILFKKRSFKSTRIPLKNSRISEDLNVERATCSSTIKDSRFPEHVELEPGQTESERISFVKVCSYHHCSLNGHCHEPPPEKKPFLRRKRQSSIPQMSVRPNSEGSGPGKKLSADKKKGAKKQQMTSNAAPRAQFLRGANATIEDSDPIEMVLNGPSCPEKDYEERLDQLGNYFTQEKGIPEATFELKERSFGCYNKRTEKDKSNSPDFAIVSEGHGTTTSFEDRENTSSHSHSLKYSRMPHDQVSICGDYDSDSKSSGKNPSYNAPNLLSSNKNEAKKETNSSSQTTIVVLASESTPAGDSKNKEQVQTRGSEPAVSSEVQKPQLGKGRNMSMWHLIHKHMVSGLAADGGSRPLQGADEGRKVEEADMHTARKSSYVIPDTFDSDMGTYNQDVEIRKLFAIKLVREAIEKILLPEVQDQLSENQSVTNDIVEEKEPSAKNHQEAPDEGFQSENRVISRGDNIQVDSTQQVQVEDSTSGLEIKKSDAKLGKKSDKKSPSNWSNLKKWILLQRFTKELEKVRKLNLQKPRQMQLETDAEAEKLSLRRQIPVDEKKRTEEWMLDYALQQVVSQLAPTQKRKVALLVKAFETVVPPQQDSSIQVQDNAPSNVEHSETNNEDMPVVDEAEHSADTCSKSQRAINVELSCSKTELSSGGSESESKIENSNDSSGVAGERSYLIQSETCEVDVKSVESGEIFPTSNENSVNSIRAPEIENSVNSEPELVNLPGIHEQINLRPKSELSSGDSVESLKIIGLGDVDGNENEPLTTFQSAIPDKIQETSTTESIVSSSLEHQAPALKETNKESRPEPVLVQKFPSMDSLSNYKENEAGQSPFEKQNYLNMWHLVCQHVVSSVASKVGIELLEEEDEQVEDANKFSGMETPAPHKDTLKGSYDMAKEIPVANHHRAEFSRSQVLKLVREAVQEILSPEIQDDSSDTLSISSEVLPDKELSDKDHGESVKQGLSASSSTGLTEQNAREFDRTEEGFSLDGKESKNNGSNEEDCRKVESLDKSKSDPPKPKNWSKLKKLILLKRSIKAMEKARKLKFQPTQQLPLPSGVEPEKVDLRHQMMDERRKAEQWMLDYAVQHIVTKLTPARKKRVAMLVEAFEAVVPLPEI